jgi:hypothetical protein
MHTGLRMLCLKKEKRKRKERMSKGVAKNKKQERDVMMLMIYDATNLVVP